LRHSWRLSRRSWAAVGAYLDGLGPLLELMLAVLGRSWDASGHSWSALRALLGRSWLLWGHSWPLLERSRGALGKLLGRSWGACGRFRCPLAAHGRLWLVLWFPGRHVLICWTCLGLLCGALGALLRILALFRMKKRGRMRFIVFASVTPPVLARKGLALRRYCFRGLGLFVVLVWRQLVSQVHPTCGLAERALVVSNEPRGSNTL